MKLSTPRERFVALRGLAPPPNVPMHTASAQPQHLMEGIEQVLEGAEQMLKREAERPAR